MRPDRVIPVSGDATGGIPLFGLGYGLPTLGNVRAEPYATLPPSIHVQTLTEQPFVTPQSGAGAALADSDSGTLTYALKEHWPWLVVGGLALAAVLWK